MRDCIHLHLRSKPKELIQIHVNFMSFTLSLNDICWWLNICQFRIPLVRIWYNIYPPMITNYWARWERICGDKCPDQCVVHKVCKTIFFNILLCINVIITGKYLVNLVSFKTNKRRLYAYSVFVLGIAFNYSMKQITVRIEETLCMRFCAFSLVVKS